MIIIEENENRDNRDPRRSKADVARFVTVRIESFFQGCLIKIGKTRGHLIAEDLINVAITFAVCALFIFDVRTSATSFELSYFYVALIVRSGGYFDVTSPNRSRYSPTNSMSRAGYAFVLEQNGCIFTCRCCGKLDSRNIETEIETKRFDPSIENAIVQVLINSSTSISRSARYVFSQTGISPRFYFPDNVVTLICYVSFCSIL